jgi:hypothetical protein
MHVALAGSSIPDIAAPFKPYFQGWIIAASKPDLAALRLHRRKPLMTPVQFLDQVYRARRELPHGRRPTPIHVKIARLLARWQHPCPSHGKLARATKCCVRTVQNALNRLRGLGLLSWAHQGATMRSGRRLQLPNRYRLIATSFVDKKEGSFLYLLQVGKLLAWHRPEPHPPVRTVAQQLAILMAG